MWHDRTVKAQSAPDSIRLAEAEQTEKRLGKEDVTSAHLYNVVVALQRIGKSCGDKKDKAVDMLTKIKRFMCKPASGWFQFVLW